MRAWAEGNDKGLVEFTGRRDLGTRILKIGDDLWLYSPDRRGGGKTLRATCSSRA